MDEDTLVLVHGIVDESKDLIACFVLRVKEDLVLLIEPVESEVLNPDVGPLVLNLTPRTIDDLGDLVGHYEF